MAKRRSDENTQHSKGGSMPEWKVNQHLKQIDKRENPISTVGSWLNAYFDFFSLSFYSLKIGIIISHLIEGLK